MEFIFSKEKNEFIRLFVIHSSFSVFRHKSWATSRICKSTVSRNAYVSLRHNISCRIRIADILIKAANIFERNKKHFSCTNFSHCADAGKSVLRNMHPVLYQHSVHPIALDSVTNVCESHENFEIKKRKMKVDDSPACKKYLSYKFVRRSVLRSRDPFREANKRNREHNRELQYEGLGFDSRVSAVSIFRILTAQ